MHSTLLLTANTIAGAAFSWTGPLNFSSNLQNPTVPVVDLGQGGNYFVTATTANCTYYDTAFVLLKVGPIRPTIVPDTPACKGGDSIYMNVYTSGIESDNYLIDPDNNIYPGVYSVIAKLIEGTYRAYALSTDGCVSDTGSVFIKLLPPQEKPVLTLMQPVCVGDPILIDAYSPGATSMHIWDRYGTHMLNYVSITYARVGNSGTYKYIAVRNKYCISDTAVIQVNVAPSIIPGVAIYGNETAGPFATVTYTSYVSDAGKNPYYTWMKNGIAIPNANGPTYTAINGTDIFAGDTISLQVKADLPSCPGIGKSNEIIIATSLAVNNREKGKTSVYPNPSSGILHINATSAYVVDVINTLGSTVYTTSATGNTAIDIRGKIPPGSYIIKISTGESPGYYKVDFIQ